jgi:L,D-transpeptidase YcbB
MMMKLSAATLFLLCAAASPVPPAPVIALSGYCSSASSGKSEQDQLLSAKLAQSLPLLPQSDARLLADFYGPCDNAPAWVRNGEITSTAIAVVQVLRDVAERGLDPGAYPLPLVPPTAIMNPTPDSVASFTRFEIQLSIEAMLLAKDLRCGRVDPHALHADLPSNCLDFRPTEFVWNMSRSQNPSSQFDALEPNAPGYVRTKNALHHYLELARAPQIAFPPLRGTVCPGQDSDNIAAVRAALIQTGDLAEPQDFRGSLYDERLVGAVKSFQKRHGLSADGLLTAETYKQMAVPMKDRAAQLGLTLERWRWIQRWFAQPPIVVNIPEFRVRAYDNDSHVALAMKVIVGGAYHRKTPVFANQISSVIFRPYWNIPPGIQRNEIEPAMRRDPQYLEKHGEEIVRGPGNAVRIRQRPGDQNALGLIKFSLPNVHDVYLHGTPAQELFNRTRRDFSHGCIRVEDPPALAEWVLRQNPGWTRDRIEAAMHGQETMSVAVSHPIPILIVYGTAFAALDGTVYFLPDIYKEDANLLAALRKATVERQKALQTLEAQLTPLI